MASQSITIKSQGDIIHILLDSGADFATLSEGLRKKVSDAKGFFEGATANVAFKGRELTKEEETLLLEVITTETTMSVTLVDGELPPPPPLQTPRAKKKVEKPTAEPPPVAAATAASYDTSNTVYHHGGLRSGQSIKFAGSVVVLGDVNPGSEIVAEGNVIVLGALKGLAHAGASGDTSCFVSALVLQPIQLRIANIITSVPPPDKKSKKEPQKAQLAYVKDGQVFIGPL